MKTPLAAKNYRRDLLNIQEYCAEQEQVELPLLHDFAPGVYGRRIFMKKDTFVIGRTHKTEHFNIVLSGVANVMIDGETKQLRAGDVFVSKPYIKKVLYILEDMVWMTIHPVDSMDMEEIEKECVLTEEEEKLFLKGDLSWLAEKEKGRGKEEAEKEEEREPRKALNKE